MKKNFLKSTIVVVAVAASSLGAWRAYNAYEVSSNKLLAENIEALSEPDEGGGFFARTTSWATKLASGICGDEIGIYVYTWSIEDGGVTQSAEVYMSKSGKLINFSTKQEFKLPHIIQEKRFDRNHIIKTGDWKVCAGPAFGTCDRRKQILCDGETDWYNDLAIPTTAIKNWN